MSAVWEVIEKALLEAAERKSSMDRAVAEESEKFRAQAMLYIERLDFSPARPARTKREKPKKLEIPIITGKRRIMDD
jgi:hypothetical protein